MQLVITPEESSRLDATASDPVNVLMERAGFGVAVAAGRLGAGYGSRVAVLAGAGNNGGDGYVAAKYLARRGCAVVVHALAPPKDAGGAAGKAATAAAAAGVPMVPMGPSADVDLVIDALFGVGFRGELPPEVLPWIGSAAPVLGVDIPSGVSAADGTVADVAFRADLTVTFHALKPGHLTGDGPDYCGVVEVIDIGLEGGEAELRVCEAPDAPRPGRSRRTHKWQAGSVAVIGGAPGMTGAPMLAARSALRMGAGSVTLVCPGALRHVYEAMAPEIMTAGIGSAERFGTGDVDAALEAVSRFDVVVLGPGLGHGREAFVAGVMERYDGFLLVDADGLNALDGVAALAARTGQTIITPHAGEYARLTGSPAGYREARRLPGETGAVVLLKGNPSFVLGSEQWVVTSGGPELATIGTGDVLAGTVAALWARGLDAEVAARSGAYWHGAAGAHVARSGTVTADQLAEAVAHFAWTV